MNTKERFDSVITSIEQRINNPELKASDIATSIAQDSGLTIQDMNAVFNYMTGMPVIRYIRHRKMMAAYDCLISSEDLDIESAIVISGLDNQSSFTKRFHSLFGLTPKEAFNKKDGSLYEKPMTWDFLSGDMKSHIEEEEIKVAEENTIFGITKEQYAKLEKVSSLQALYGFDQLYSQVAFDLSEEENFSMEKSFEYLDSIQSMFEEIDEFSSTGSDVSGDMLISLQKRFGRGNREFMVHQCAFDSLFQFMFFNCGISVTLSVHKLKFLTGHEEEAMEMEPFQLYEYVHTEEMAFDYYKRACDYYDSQAGYGYSDEDFSEYVSGICSGASFEEVLDWITPSDDGTLDDIDRHKITEMLEEIMLPDPFEQENDENDRWEGVRLDIEYDEENIHYDQEDDTDNPIPGNLDF